VISDIEHFRLNSEAKTQGLTLLEDMLGHPGMARYRDAGFEIITF